ncbi:hypothetical protein H8A95_09270 [Bradyrhizobium sp. Pear76]|uniref:hypothetical protein n=1 Tax=Bradyrhizobium oropedii TaxID=1571201 RepID=UPI001E4BCEB4|nr:hypothetical protein [Bradyrhizobium oropedii]MCC8962494.1 hypothetical protein [Bradyrhizobium oropedii]
MRTAPLTSLADWEEALTRRFLTAAGEGVGPIRSFEISPETLAMAAGWDASAGALAVSSFRKALLGDWHLYAALEDGSFDRRLAPDCPGCFSYLALTIFVDSQRDDDVASEFRPKLAAFLGVDRSFSKLTGVATMWRSLRDWLARQVRAGKPFRKLVLPADDGWVQIGYTLRLSFPSRRDHTFLGHFFDQNPGIASDEKAMLASLRNLVDRTNASKGLHEAFDEFYAAYSQDRRSLADHRFWKLVLSVAAARNVQMPSDVSMEVYPDEDGLPHFRVDVVDRSDRGSVHATLQSAVAAVAKLGGSNLSRVAEAGYVVFKRIGTSRWAAVPRFSECRGEVRIGLCSRLTAAVGTKLGRLRASGDWTLTVDPVSIARAEDALRRLLAKEDLPQVISGVTVAGGIRTDHHWLGRRSVLPTITTDLGLPMIVAEGDDDAPALACKEIEPSRYAITSKRPVAGTFELRSSASTAARLHFVADAFVHDGQRPSNHDDAPEWRECVRMLGETAEPPTSWDPVPEKLDDLIESVYAGGRRGWAEADLIPLLERIIPDDMSPWDFLRSLQESTVLTPLLRSRHRGRTWILGTVSLVPMRSRNKDFVLVDGCVPALQRRDFKQAVAALGGSAFRRTTSAWAAPLMGATGVTAEKLRERLDWPIKAPTMPGRRPAAFDDDPQRRLEAYRKAYVWSWDAGRFTSEATTSRVELARWVHLGERDHDVYVVSETGGERMFLSRCVAIAHAHMLANRPMFRREADRLLRTGRDAFVPDQIAFWLRYENLANPLVGPAGGYSYQASQAQVTAIARLLPGAIDAGATLSASWEAVAAARRRGFVERLVFTEGRVLSSRTPFDPTQRSHA